MSRVSCIEHRARSPFVMLRRDYMALCDNDACAAMLVSVFEHWTNTRLNSKEERGGDIWIYRSREQLRDQDLCGAFGLERIDKALLDLRVVGLLTRRNNPDAGWDRKWQYLLSVPAVQRAINRLNTHSLESEDGALESEDASSESPASILGKPSSNTEDSQATQGKKTSRKDRKPHKGSEQNVKPTVLQRRRTVKGPCVNDGTKPTKLEVANALFADEERREREGLVFAQGLVDRGEAEWV